MHLNVAIFAAIQAEARRLRYGLNDPKRQVLAVGDVLTFVSLADANQKVTTRVVSLHAFSTFAQLYQYYSHEAVGSLAKVVAETYVTFTPACEQRCGALAIGVQVL
ncbi:ASCH domain-containing protein [Levilactobacillus tujiorum]|uniref:isomerase n=1 Tax=Levilactobacillus tujiorum TaxID=2912243 RepID=UPI0014576ED3|nr:isomerase [Levilactobacillus tujiorum]NLR32944.1 isomerase [Levilactobacillus tujiorum]